MIGNKQLGESLNTS